MAPAQLKLKTLNANPYVFLTQFGSGSKAPAEESVTATIPDGEAQKMSDSKSEAFRGRVSTEDYFAELGSPFLGKSGVLYSYILIEIHKDSSLNKSQYIWIIGNLCVNLCVNDKRTKVWQ